MTIQTLKTAKLIASLQSRNTGGDTNKVRQSIWQPEHSVPKNALLI